MENIFTDDLDLLNEDSTIDLDEDQDLAIDFSIGVNECATELMIEVCAVNSITNESFMDGVKDKIKSAIEAIKRFFQKVWKKITEYYNKVVTFLFNWEKRNAKWVKDNSSEISKAISTKGTFTFKAINGENPIAHLNAIDTYKTAENEIEKFIASSDLSKDSVEAKVKEIEKQVENNKEKLKTYPTEFSFSDLNGGASLTGGTVIADIKKSVTSLGTSLQRARDKAIKTLESAEKKNEHVTEIVSGIRKLADLEIKLANHHVSSKAKALKQAYAFIKKGVSEAKKVNRTA